MSNPITEQPQLVQTIVTSRPPVGPDSTALLCPSCGKQISTRLDYETTTKTHIVAGIICIIGGCLFAWIPYVVNSCKNANHYCPSCGAFIGIYS